MLRFFIGFGAWVFEDARDAIGEEEQLAEFFLRPFLRVAGFEKHILA